MANAIFAVGNRVSCSAIKVLGKKPAKQRFGRLSGTKELDGVVEEAQGMTTLYFAMEYNGRSLMEFLKTGDACLDLEHTSCGWMRCIGHHSTILCCQFHSIC